MKTLFLFLSFSFIVFFSACAGKRVYEPSVDTQDWQYQGDIEDDIVQITATAALLEDNKVLLDDASKNIILTEGFSLLFKNEKWVISASTDGKMQLHYIDDPEIVEEFNLEKTIASASIDGDTLAVIFANNDIALYSIVTKELLFKERAGDVSAIDARITPPFFTSGLVIFSTLNGKVVIVNIAKKKKLRSVSVSSEENFNNVLFLDIVESKIVAATTHKILSMSKDELRKKYDIRSVATDENRIYITTKQGEIILLNTALEENGKLKFPFAHFLGAIATQNNVYILEKEGYLIVAKADLSSYDVYEVDIDDGSVFISNNKFYVNDEYISIKE